ncbi:hypothetical protein [Paracoccus sp. KR1-242]|uniref:hypothetical protein n=1 Tax=Paracoccus sp. KR1-242 TaxID=3410028 RepID=UPI003C07BD87
MEATEVKPQARGSISHLIEPQHKAAARMLGYALTVGTPGTWHRAAIVWEAQLTQEERCAVAESFLLSLPPDEVAALAEDELAGLSAVPPFARTSDAASWWASDADIEERGTYLIAIWEVMTPEEKTAFLGFALGRAAA